MICRVCRQKRECYPIERQPDHLVSYSMMGPQRLLVGKPGQQYVCSSLCEQFIERGRELWDVVRLATAFPTKEQINDVDEPVRSMMMDQIHGAGRLPWVRVN